MSDQPFFEDEQGENWKRFLTPALKQHFKRHGPYLVEQQVLHLRFRDVDKRKAAMVWLGQERFKQRCWNTVGLIVGAVASIAAAFGGAWLGAYINAQSSRDLKEHQDQQARAALVQVFISDINSLKEFETSRFARLKAPLKKMTKMDSLKDAGGRPWLMASVPTQFPVFENNAGSLGLLPKPIPEQVVQFYGQSYALRAQINLVIGTPILWASTDEQAQAVKDYGKELQQWRQQADEVVAALEQCCN